MPLDSTASPDEIRERAGLLLGHVRDQLVRIHTSCVDDRSARELKHDLIPWLRDAIEVAARNLADHECEAAFDRLNAVQGMLRDVPDDRITAEWLRSTAREIERLHGKVLLRLEGRLHPEWLDNPDYDPDDREYAELLRQQHVLQNGGPHVEVLPALGLKIDTERGTVTRAGDRYQHTRVPFKLGTAEWHWVRLAVKHWAAGGATEDRVRDGYPENWTTQASRAAKYRASKKLKALDLSLSDGYPVEIVDVTQT